MNGAFDLYTHDVRILIPVVAMFIIIFAIVLRSMKEMPLFEGGAKVVVALCVSLLAMWGMDQAFIRPVLMHYSAMGMAMLVGLTALHCRSQSSKSEYRITNQFITLKLVTF